MPISPNLTELATTTIENRSRELADNVTKNNKLLRELNKKGRVKPFSGGRIILDEMSYAENSTFMYYSGADQISVAQSDVLTSAQFDIKQAACAVTMTGLEQIQNAGKEAFIDLLESRMDVAEKTLMNNIAIGLYSDGTGFGGKQITGLAAAVSDTPTTGTYGNIDRSTWAFWRNQAFSSTTDGGAAATSANIQSYMNRLYMRCVRGNDAPNLIVADNNYFRLYLESLQANQRFSRPADKYGALGPSVNYMGETDVLLDGGIGGGLGSNRMYFLNTDYIYFRPHAARNFVTLNGERNSLNQDMFVKLIAWAGNLVCSGAQFQGVLRN